MSIVRRPESKGIVALFIALSVGITLLSLPANASAAPAGTTFNHIVIIAMENQNYGSVIGSSSAPFINSLAAAGTTISNYHSYGQNIGGCSAGCYEAFTSGQQSHSDGWCPRASSPCYTISNVADQLHTAGLTSAMFCEDGCPRGADHFPWIAYTSTWNSCVTGSFTCSGQTGPDGNQLYASSSSNGNSAFINYLDSASPASYIWFTPTDSHNMHDNSVSSGDSYLQGLLVGTGSIANPSANSVLGSTLFKQPGTFLYVWWDEYDPSPNVEFGSMIKVAHTSTGGYTEYDSLHTIEANWGLPYITSVVSGDTGMTDVFGSVGPLPLSGSFTYQPNSPVASTVVSFTSIASGGTSPYSYAWNFGDGGTSTSVSPTHTYSSAGNYTVTLTVTDSVSATAKSTQTITVAPIPQLVARLTYSPTQPTSGQSVSFSATGSGGVSPYAYNWNFGDGSTSTGLNPSHTYSTSGSFTVSLNVTDSLGTLATSSKTITISPPGALTTSFIPSPSVPTSGQTVTFTATTTGGTNPYSYSWNLGGTTKTGNPVSQSFTNGTYSISLTVTDSAGKTATASQSLTVISNSGGGTVPVLIGWGGIRLDEAAVGGGVNHPTNPPPSNVFPGESATNMELVLIEIQQMGYNTVRVDFDPYCTASQYMSAYSATNLQRAIQIAQYYHFWIIVDYHGYSEPFNSSQASCWLNFWSGVTNQFKNSYSQIIWEPLNEPCYDSSSCAGSSTTNDQCSGAAACVSTLSKQYQSWIDQTRAQGDTHWIVVQNICSYGCSLSNWATGFPTVTDPLGTLSQGGRIFISLHSYMGYSSSNWNNSTADSMAQQYYQAVVSGVSTTGWPALNTEGGADPLCTSCAPDQVLTGSAGYTVVTMHFIQALTTLYDTNTPQRINWIWWPAGSWTNTPGAGIYGALQCTSPPFGWGCLLTFLPLGPPKPDFEISASAAAPTNLGQSSTSTITVTALNGFTGTVSLTDSVPNALTCSSISPNSLSSSGTATLSCTGNTGGAYTVIVTGTSGSIIHSAIATFIVKQPDFSVNTPQPAAVNAGQSSIATFTITAFNGFSSTVTLTDNVPSGLNCGNLSPTSVAGSGSATISCTATNAGGYILTITGTSGSLTHSSIATFTFQDFSVVATSPQAVNPGSSATSTITVNSLNGFSGAISISISPSSGLSCGSPSPTSLSGSGTATFSCSSNTQNVYSVTVTGTSASLTHSITTSFTFGNPPDFTITSTTPSALDVGSSASSTITISFLNGLNSPVTLAKNSPSGLNCGSLSSTSLTASGTATLSCSSTSASTYTLIITGTSGSLTHSSSIVFTFQDFSLTTSTSNIAFSPGAQGTAMITLNTLNGFGSTVTLTSSSNPSGPTVSFSSSSISGTQGSTITVSSGTAGTYTLVITGTSGSMIHSATITLTVGNVLLPPIMSVPHNGETATVGKALTFTISASDPNSAGNTITLTASGLQPNMAFDPVSGVFTFTPDQSQEGKTYNVTFTATYNKDPSTSTTQTVTIRTQNASGQPSTGPIPTGMTTMIWLLTIGALVGVVSSIAILHVRATAELAAARKRARPLNARTRQSRQPNRPQGHRVTVSQASRKRISTDD